MSSLVHRPSPIQFLIAVKTEREGLVHSEWLNLYHGSTLLYLTLRDSTMAPASWLRRSVSFLWFTCQAWPSTGRGVVRASCIRSVEIKTAKNVFKRVWRQFCEILHQRKFPAIQVVKLSYHPLTLDTCWVGYRIVGNFRGFNFCV